MLEIKLKIGRKVESMKAINKFAEEFLLGFSQGCAMSLCYALTSNKKFGGIIGFSGHLFQSFNLKIKVIYLLFSKCANVNLLWKGKRWTRP